jgi:hypothetical protein
MVSKVLTGNGVSSPIRWAGTLCGGVHAAAALMPTARGSGPLAQPSQVQAAEQFFDRAAQLSGHVLEDLPQGADPERLVGSNGEVLLLALRASGQPLMCDCPSKASARSHGAAGDRPGAGR